MARGAPLPACTERGRYYKSVSHLTCPHQGGKAHLAADNVAKPVVPRACAHHALHVHPLAPAPVRARARASVGVGGVLGLEVELAVRGLARVGSDVAVAKAEPSKSCTIWSTWNAVLSRFRLLRRPRLAEGPHGACVR